ncbi:MAG: AAA family ATPase [Gloeotrichia echinulata HAB0833]
MFPKNPYIIGRPITETELFFGRDKLFRFIEDNLNQGVKVILLHGQRRIGKSSVLSHIPKQVLNDKFKFVRFDLQDKSQLSLSNILQSLAVEIIAQLDVPQDKITVINDAQAEVDLEIFSNRFLPTVYQALDGKNLVLLLDEFDVLSSDAPTSAEQHFFRYLKSLVNTQNKLFVIPVVGRKLDDLPNLLEMFKGAPYTEVGLLDEPSTRKLITEPAKGLLDYDSDAIQAILELSAGSPYFTQVICFAIFIQFQDNLPHQVTRADVDNILKNAFEFAQGGLISFWNGLPIPEQIVFLAVANLQESDNPLKEQEPLTLLKEYGLEYGVDKINPLLEAKKQLLKWGFLHLHAVKNSNLHRETVTTYKVTIELIRQWLLSRYSLKDVIYKLETFDTKANLLYTEATETDHQGKVENAIKLYEEVLNINPNHFNAMFKLAERYLDVKQFSQAIKLYEKLCKLDLLSHKDGLVQARLKYGDHLMQENQLYLAREQFNKLLFLEPKNELAKAKQKEVATKIRNQLSGPYCVGTPVPPDKFVGRKDDVKIAFAQIFNSSNWVFYGSSGIGKTSFLKYLAAPETWDERKMNTNNEHLLVYLNCESIHEFTSSAFWKEVFIELKEFLSRLQENIDDLSDEIDKVLKEVAVEKNHVKHILRQIKRQDKFLVLLLDNYQVVLSPKDNYSQAEMQKFVKEFRNLAEHHADRSLASIMTSSQDLGEFAQSAIFDDLPSARPLKPFQNSEVEILWNLMPERFRQRKDLQETVQTITGGYPALVQKICFLLYRRLNEAEPLTIETIENDFELDTEQILRGIWQSLNTTERMLLRLIALYNVGGKIETKTFDLSGIDNELKQNRLKLKDLEQRGIIRSKFNQDKTKTVYSFTASAMQKWVIDEILNNSEAEAAERERVFLVMNKGHVNQIKNLIELAQKNPDFVKSIAGGIMELLKSLM